MSLKSTLEGSCGFYLKKKQRFCKFVPNANDKFCPQHACTSATATGNSGDGRTQRKRIPCPLDPNHTCYEDRVKKHLNRCNEGKKQNDTPICYQKGINSGDDENEEILNQKLTVLTASEDHLLQTIEKINKLYDEYVCTVDTEILTHTCLKEELENPTYGIPALRHRKQQASLLGHMDKLGVLSEGHCFVEMGAGKGQLSHWVHQATQDVKDVSYLLIDKSSIRNKFDLRNRCDEGLLFERIRIDIEDLRLGKCAALKEGKRKVVAMGKHLCGAATDLALRCVVETLSLVDPQEKAANIDGTEIGRQTADGQPPPKKSKSENQSSQQLLAGVVIALCCHHRCVWRSYVGKSFMQSCGFTGRDFQLLTSISSWATCTWKGWKQANASKHKEKTTESEVIGEEEHAPEENADDAKTLAASNRVQLDLSEAARELIGWKCKRLIDYGRVMYMRDHKMDGYLRQYIDSHFTPENIVLISHPPHPSTCDQ